MHWARQVVLRAMAALEQRDIVVIRSLTCADSVSLYPCDGPTRLCVTRSWRDDVVPRILRQQQAQPGGLERMVSVRVPFHVHPSRSLKLPEREISVLVWNGVDHYDGTCAEVAAQD